MELGVETVPGEVWWDLYHRKLPRQRRAKLVPPERRLRVFTELGHGLHAQLHLGQADCAACVSFLPCCRGRSRALRASRYLGLDGAGRGDRARRGLVGPISSKAAKAAAREARSTGTTPTCFHRARARSPRPAPSRPSRLRGVRLIPTLLSGAVACTSS